MTRRPAPTVVVPPKQPASSKAHGHKSLLHLVAPKEKTWGHKELLKLRNFLDSENGDEAAVAKRHLAAMRHEAGRVCSSALSDPTLMCRCSGCYGYCSIAPWAGPSAASGMRFFSRALGRKKNPNSTPSSRVSQASPNAPRRGCPPPASSKVVDVVLECTLYLSRTPACVPDLIEGGVFKALVPLLTVLTDQQRHLI